MAPVFALAELRQGGQLLVVRRSRCMTRIRWAPLLRGIGATIILLGTLIAYFAERQDDGNHRLKPQLGVLQVPSGKGSATTGNLVVTNVVEVGLEDDNEAVALGILGNRYFEWMGLIGTAIFASSFYVEAFVRSSKNT